MAFEVWAPRARKVTLVLGSETVALDLVGDGWWSARGAAEWSTGVDYGYLLDDDTTPLPDPRSRRQPAGVHGLSRSFDPGEYSWRDTAWQGMELAGRTIYELHIGTFTPGGTLDSAIDRLEHLVELGIDFVEVLPVNGFNGAHNWGYDGVLWYAVQETYGGPAAYQRFVDACHERGLGVIQDVVYNHLGPSGNYLPRFGPYLDDQSSNTWGTTVNLAQAEVREYIIRNALMWMGDYHVDGLRLDAVHALVDSSDQHLLQELAERTKRLSTAIGRPLTLIAESDLNDPKLITPIADGGYGLTAQWSDDYHHAAHVNLTGETSGYYADFGSLAALAKTMTRGFFHDGTFSSFRGRNHGVPIDLESIPTWRLVTFTQDHDQIGNRAIGDRLTATLNLDQQAIAAVLTLLGPFTPMLFMGEEWGASTPWQFFTSHPEPELGTATAEGRIAEFEKMGWDPTVVPDPQDPKTFADSKLDWAELEEPGHAGIYALYRELIALRRKLPGLTNPAFSSVQCEFDETAKWFRMTRPGVSVLVNFADYEQQIPATDGFVMLSTSGHPEPAGGSIILGAHSAVVLRD